MDTLEQRLMRYEGWSAHPYKDTEGYLTIGYGRNLDAVGISRAEGLLMFRNDIQTAKEHVFAALPWAVRLDERRQEVLIEMAFQMGVGGLLSFKKTLAFVEAGEYEQAAREMLDSKWARQTEQRAREVAARMA